MLLAGIKVDLMVERKVAVMVVMLVVRLVPNSAAMKVCCWVGNSVVYLVVYLGPTMVGKTVDLMVVLMVEH